MKVSFTSLNLKTKAQEHKQKQDKRIIQNLQTQKSRKYCIVSLFELTGALACFFCPPAVTDKILSKTNMKINYFTMDALLGFGILGAGAIGGRIFSKIDEKKNTKFGDFAYRLFNGKNSKLDTEV